MSDQTGANQTRQRSDMSFAQWLRHNHLDDFAKLLGAAYDDLLLMASDTGIDLNALLTQMPCPGELLKGSKVPTLEPRDRGRCAFVWHLNKDRHNREWPCLVFMTFRHAGIQHIFHGRRWAWLRYQSDAGVPLAVAEHPLRVAPENRKAAQQEQRRRTARFRQASSEWALASAASAANSLLQKRLRGHADNQLLARIDLRHIEDQYGGYLQVALRHRQHNLSGFQQLHGRALDTSGRSQHLVIRSEGMKRGAFVIVKAQAGFEDWPVGICEGVFTGLSIALGWPGPMAIALDAGNLKNVRRHITCSCVLFADDDAWSIRNTGMLSAKAACTLGDTLCSPEFDQAHGKQHPTDFNDLLRLSGIDELRNQICRVFPTGKTTP